MFQFGQKVSIILKLKSNYNQRQVKDAMEVENDVDLFLCELLWFILEFKMVEIWLLPTLICSCNMWASYSVSGWGLVQLCF